MTESEFERWCVERKVHNELRWLRQIMQGMLLCLAGILLTMLLSAFFATAVYREAKAAIMMENAAQKARMEAFEKSLR